MDFKFTVVELPEIKISGISVETDMNNAGQDCPALWHSFGPRVCSELADCADISQGAESYGVSKMIDANRFTYWAAIKVNNTDNLPADFETMVIPAGLYVKGVVPSLEELSEAFNTMYMQWPQTQQEYQLDMEGICFELYSDNWQITDPLEIYASVIKK